LRLRFCALASGSRGNALLVEHDNTLVLVDCGLSLKALDARLVAVGYRVEDIDAVLITHEHQDHVRGIGPLLRRHAIPLWTTSGTACSVDAIESFERVRPDRELKIGSISVQPYPVPHDAREPCHFVFRGGGRRLGLLTDTGHVTPVMREALSACDALGVEFNHDRAMLENGSYPESVKARVGSRYGHLSNDQAAGLLGDLAHPDLQWVTGLHLSEQNNSVSRVRASAAGFTAGVQTEFHLASQDEPGPWLEVR